MVLGSKLALSLVMALAGSLGLLAMRQRELGDAEFDRLAWGSLAISRLGLFALLFIILGVDGQSDITV